MNICNRHICNPTCYKTNANMLKKYTCIVPSTFSQWDSFPHWYENFTCRKIW
jgi:hypothetical protein